MWAFSIKPAKTSKTNKKKNTLKANSVVDLFILKYLLFLFHWTNEKIYIYIYINPTIGHIRFFFFFLAAAAAGEGGFYLH